MSAEGPSEWERARSRLTGPLVAVDGISAKDLGRELGLAHSTVSGIVGRLARRNLVERKDGERDRRVTRVLASHQVRAWMRNRQALHRVSPLVKELRLALRHPPDRGRPTGAAAFAGG